MKIIVNNNKELVDSIRKALKENDGFCPCRIERTPETKCMCKDFLDAPAPCECHCGLYIKTE